MGERMKKKVLIGTHEVELEANAATPIRFRNIFGEDLLTIISKGTVKGGIDLSVASQVASELVFIMAKTAERADMTTLNKESMLEWLEQFEAMDVVDATEEIFSVYFGDSLSTVESKKKAKDELKGN